MNTPQNTHANTYAQVHAEELDEWVWLITRVEEWLLNAGDDTTTDYNEFTGRRGPQLQDVADMLGHTAVRMRNLAEGQR